MVGPATGGSHEGLRRFIRAVPNFPRAGVSFKDISPLLANPEAFRRATAAMAAPFEADRPTHVAAIESRGFLFAGPIALGLGAAIVPLRKAGKLPAETVHVEYALEYGRDRLEMHRDACDAQARVLIVDDVLATGGTARAACDLVEAVGARVVGCSFLLSLDDLGGRRRLSPYVVNSVLDY